MLRAVCKGYDGPGEMTGSGGQWLAVVYNVLQWLAVVMNGYEWFEGVLAVVGSGWQWL